MQSFLGDYATMIQNPTQENNPCYSDHRLSPQALGVYLYLKSLPPDWNIKTSDISYRFQVGLTFSTRTMKRLISLGYITSTRERKGNRFAGIKYEVMDRPLTTQGDSHE